MKSLMIMAAMAAVGFQAHAATGTAKAQMKVLSTINVTKVSDLLFAEASAGAAAETVNADTTETAQNASFDVTGEPNRAVTVNLPADGTVFMRTAGGGSPTTEVAVNGFTSNALTNIDASGVSQLFVGATRADLDVAQQAGDYEADFDVEVIY